MYMYITVHQYIILMIVEPAAPVFVVILTDFSK